MNELRKVVRQALKKHPPSLAGTAVFLFLVSGPMPLGAELAATTSGAPLPFETPRTQAQRLLHQQRDFEGAFRRYREIADAGAAGAIHDNDYRVIVRLACAFGELDYAAQLGSQGLKRLRTPDARSDLLGRSRSVESVHLERELEFIERNRGAGSERFEAYEQIAAQYEGLREWGRAAEYFEKAAGCEVPEAAGGGRKNAAWQEKARMLREKLGTPALTSAMDWGGGRGRDGVAVELERARSIAKAEGKDLLLLLTEWHGDASDEIRVSIGEGCPECVDLVDDALRDAKVRKQVERSFVPVQLRAGWTGVYAELTGSEEPVYPALFILSPDGVCLSETVPDAGGRDSAGKVRAHIGGFLQGHLAWKRARRGAPAAPTQAERIEHPFPCRTAFLPVPSDDARFPRPDDRSWWEDKTRRTEAQEQLRRAEEAGILAAFLAGAGPDLGLGAGPKQPRLRLAMVAVVPGAAAAIVDAVYDEGEAGEFMSYLAYLASDGGGSPDGGKSGRYRLVSLRPLAGSFGIRQVHRIQAVETSHEGRPLLHLYRAEGSHVMMVWHELYRMEAKGLKLLWRSEMDEYLSWGFPGQRGPNFAISNVDFSGLRGPENRIVVYSTLVERGLARYEKTEIPWDGKIDAFLAPGRTADWITRKPPAGKH